MSENGYVVGPWRLDDLFAGVDAPAVDEAVATLQEGVEAFAAYREQLSPDIAPDSFRAIIDDYEALYRQASRLAGFSSLTFAAGWPFARSAAWAASLKRSGRISGSPPENTRIGRPTAAICSISRMPSAVVRSLRISSRDTSSRRQ